MARNISEGVLRISRSRFPPLLVSAVGDDAAGAALLASCSALGLPTEGISKQQGHSTACVAVVLDGCAAVCEQRTLHGLLALLLLAGGC